MDIEEERRRRTLVRVAIQSEMAYRGWNIAQLREATDIDAGTLGDFLAGNRWPRIKTIGAIEKGLGWPAGTVLRIIGGAEPPPVGGHPAGPVEDPLRQDILEHPRLSDRDKRLLLAQYDAMLKEVGLPRSGESSDAREMGA